MFKDKINYKLVNILVFILIIYLILLTSNYWAFLLVNFVVVLLPFLMSFSLAYVLHPFVKKLERKGVNKKLAVFFIIFSITVLTGTVLYFSLPIIYNQLINFTKSITIFMNDISTKFNLDLGLFQNTLSTSLNNLINDLGNYVSTGTIKFLSDSISTFTKAIIVTIVSIYFVLDMDRIREFFKKFLKSFKNKKIFKFVKQLDKEMSNYFLGLVIFMLIQFIEYSFLYLIIGHPNWLLIGTLAFFSSLIPYFGGFITNLIAVITASVVSPTVFIASLIISIIFPNIDGYLISPKIYGKTNNLNPVVIIFVITVGSYLFGILGIVAAIPTYIFVKLLWQFFNKEIKEKIQDVSDNDE